MLKYTFSLDHDVIITAAVCHRAVLYMLQMTVRKTLGTFKRTHLDSWHDHKQKFTDDQLVVLTELLVSPNYYA